MILILIMGILIIYGWISFHIGICIQFLLRNGQYKNIIGIRQKSHFGGSTATSDQIIFVSQDVKKLMAFKWQFDRSFSFNQFHESVFSLIIQIDFFWFFLQCAPNNDFEILFSFLYLSKFQVCLSPYQIKF